MMLITTLAVLATVSALATKIPFLVVATIFLAGLTFIFYKFGFRATSKLWVRIVGWTPFAILWPVLINAWIQVLR